MGRPPRLPAASAVLCLAALWPQAALANAGTPLMWLGMLHLAIGNLGIGLLEGVLLWRLTGARPWRAILLMIAANYLSAAAGAALLAFNERYATLLLGRWYFMHPVLSICIIYLGLVAFTVLAEAPFCRWAQDSGRRSWRRTLRASLTLQAASYLLITPLYYLASRVEVRDWKFAAPAPLADFRGYVLFLGADGMTLQKLHFSDPTRIETLERAPTHLRSGGLSLDLTSTGGSIRLDYFGYLPKGSDPQKPGPGLVASGYQQARSTFVTAISRESASASWVRAFEQRASEAARIPADRRYERHALDHCRTPFDYSAPGDEWKIEEVATWAIGGVTFAKRADPSAKRRFAVEAPPFWWNARCPTLLPGDRVILTLGRNLVLAHLKTGQLTWLGLGGSPLVVLEP